MGRRLRANNKAVKVETDNLTSVDAALVPLGFELSSFEVFSRTLTFVLSSFSFRAWASVSILRQTQERIKTRESKILRLGHC